MRDRLSFMWFLGLGLEDRVPDAKTVWLYREALAQAGQVEMLFKQFDGYLARQGYIARGGQILDASIVPVPRNHNTREENQAIKNGEVPEDWADEPAKRSQKHPDARWTKKHGKSHYGYKNHVNMDRKHKLVRRYHVSDAALHDSQAVDHLLMRGNTGAGVWADPAYRSEEMEARLHSMKLKSHIHCKGIYTTNAMESLNRVLRKTLKTKGSFPTEEAATKLIFLAIRNFEKGGRAVREWVAARNQLGLVDGAGEQDGPIGAEASRRFAVLRPLAEAHLAGAGGLESGIRDAVWELGVSRATVWR